MDIEYTCACGTYMELTDVAPATAELFWETFTRDHPHREQRAEDKQRMIQEEITKQFQERWGDSSG